MEELVSTEALEKEILEDARKKAERLLRGADEEAKRIADAVEPKRAAAAAELERGYAERSAAYRADAMARLPLEKARLRAEYVDARLREAIGAFMGALPAGRVGALVEARLAAAAEYLDGRDLRVRRRSMDAAAAGRAVSAALPRAKVLEMAEDASLPAAGLVVETADGASVLRATLDIVEEALLDERRGELAAALCPEALGIEAPRGGNPSAEARSL